MDKITLAAARVNAGFTIEAAAAHIGRAVGTVGAWESFTSEPKISDAQKLSKLYGRNIDAIAWTKEDKE